MQRTAMDEEARPRDRPPTEAHRIDEAKGLTGFLEGVSIVVQDCKAWIE